MNKRTKARKDADWLRKYGSEDRVNWVAVQYCLACGKSPCDNAHITTGGTGYKSDYTNIVPLCREHHRQCSEPGGGQESFAREFGLDLKAEAANIQRRWLEENGQRQT